MNTEPTFIEPLGESGMKALGKERELRRAAEASLALARENIVALEGKIKLQAATIERHHLDFTALRLARKFDLSDADLELLTGLDAVELQEAAAKRFAGSGSREASKTFRKSGLTTSED